MEVAHGATRSLDAGNALKWSGATPLFATCSWRKKRGGRSSPHVLREARLGARGEWVCCYQSRRATSFSRGTDSSPARFATHAESYSVRVRFARHNESKVYCSRECRGDAQRSSTHRRGRPRKYKTDRECRAAKTRQQQVYRSHPNVEKTVHIQSETKNLQTQKVPLSYLGTPGPGEPLILSQRT